VVAHATARSAAAASALAMVATAHSFHVHRFSIVLSRCRLTDRIIGRP
jgi:hypothetical protein